MAETLDVPEDDGQPPMADKPKMKAGRRKGMKPTPAEDVECTITGIPKCPRCNVQCEIYHSSSTTRYYRCPNYNAKLDLTREDGELVRCSFRGARPREDFQKRINMQRSLAARNYMDRELEGGE